MKLLCDVCDKGEASVFCSADEAALCEACDHRVHHANKLASKHQRFSLLHPSSKQVPLCDICQERRAFLFCQQDRAVLCINCDVAIHKASQHTQKHNRFLLTGVKLSPTSDLQASSSPVPSLTTACDAAPSFEFDPQIAIHQPVSCSSSSSLEAYTRTTSTYGSTKGSEKNNKNIQIQLIDEGKNNSTGSCSSSITEYLIDTLPGWQVEDFLDPSFPPYGFDKSVNNGFLQFGDSDTGITSSRSSENLGIWVPQASAGQVPSDMAFGEQICFEPTNAKSNRRWMGNGFPTVPQRCPSNGSSKRPKSYCQ